MVAYLAVPLGVGRRVLARVDAAVEDHRLRRDRSPAVELAGLRARLLTYVLAVAGNTALSVVNGDPYRLLSTYVLAVAGNTALSVVNGDPYRLLSRVELDETDPAVTLSRSWQQRGTTSRRATAARA